MQTVQVPLGERSYPVIICGGLLDQSGPMFLRHLGQRTAAIVTDDNVAPLYLPRLEASLQAAGIAFAAALFITYAVLLRKQLTESAR